MSTTTNKKLYEYEKDIDTVLFYYKNSVCLILRNPEMGYLCGYVGLSEFHDLFGKHYNEIMDLIDCDIELTWSGQNLGHPLSSPYNGLHWVGFDCGHWDEWMPKMPCIGKYNKDLECTYRTISWVMDRCMHLADAIENRTKKG